MAVSESSNSFSIFNYQPSGMSRNAPQPTVWERLTTNGTIAGQRSGDGRVYGSRQVCESIRQDITRLLNTRACCLPWDADLKELYCSLANFGVPDYTGGNMMDASARESLRRGLEDAIRNFEPRLASIRVTFPEEMDQVNRTIRLRVNATLSIGDLNEIVSFESRLDPQQRRFRVEVSG